MMGERRKSQRIAVAMTVGLVLSDGRGKALAGPVKAALETLSSGGCSAVIASMQADGIHLFYECNDREGCCLTVSFSDSAGQQYTISGKPVWFDKELNAEPFFYRLGLEFFRAEDHQAIKLLDRIARGKPEKDLSEVLGDFFKKRKDGP